MRKDDKNKKDIKQKIKKRAIYEAKEWGKAFVVAFIVALIIRLFVFETMMVPTGSMIPTIIPQDRIFIEKITYTVREPEIGEMVVFWSPFVDREALKMLRLFDKFMDLFSPKQFKGHVKYVKRLVGKEGDVLELVKVGDKGYKLLVNGKAPKSLEDRYYQAEGIFKDPRFYEKLAYPSKAVGVEKLFFERLNEAISYTEYYEKYLKNLNLRNYVWFDPKSGRVKVKVPRGFYFMMGDNSPESLDSRFFGFVPKENVVGRPMLRIWPFSRFGTIEVRGGERIERERAQSFEGGGHNTGGHR